MPISGQEERFVFANGMLRRAFAGLRLIPKSAPSVGEEDRTWEARDGYVNEIKWKL